MYYIFKIFNVTVIIFVVLSKTLQDTFKEFFLKSHILD